MEKGESMSLILKGIDMPKTEYEEVIIRIKHTGEVCDAQNIHLYAQAIQIPKGHGRLIDIEKLKEEFAMKNNICKECDSFKNCDNKTYSKSEICENFIWVPIFLEAEE